MGEGIGPAHRLTDAARLEPQWRVRAGETHQAAAAAVGCSAKSVQRLLRKTGGLKPPRPLSSGVPLSLAEREEISRGLLAGESCRTIASRLGRAPSTIPRDVAATGGRDQSRAWRADDATATRRRRPKPSKRAPCARLRRAVERGRRRRWSPHQIVARRAIEFPEAPTMRVSHETIDQALFVQGRGALRQALTRCLRTGRAQRRPHGRVPGTGRLKDLVLISARPADAEDRAVPGHWEGDRLVGTPGRSALATRVERQTRLVLRVRLPRGRLAADVQNALVPVVRGLPAQRRRSLTWDHGKAMGAPVPFPVATGVQVYCCDPRRPWQRATNENSNGWRRQYFPKGADLTRDTPRERNAVAAELNGRPRRVLNWLTPAESFARVVAGTP